MLQLGQTTGGYANSQLCAGCHPKIAQTYALTGMARSFYRPRPRHDVEDLQRDNPLYHQPSGTWYSMQRRDGAYVQRRWRIGPDGKELSVQESSIDYVMGSGNRVRTYLHRTARGALVELPLSWYAEDGGTWAMSPGHDRSYMLPPRLIAYECMFCHNAYPQIPAGHDEPGAEPLYAGELPEGIDCQRCHGSGGSHIRAAQTNAGLEAVRKAIVNPARLSPERQLEVCMQCHLETTSLPLPHSIQRYGRPPFDYRAGEPLGDFMIFFDHAAGSKHKDDFEIAHSAYRLRESRCFQKSKGKLTCTTCHNPHDIPRGEQAAAHYNGVCLECHAALVRAEVAQGKHTASPGCTACHMPKRRTQDVVHAVMTDHLIQRHQPARDPLARIPEREEFDANQYRREVVPYYPAPLPRTGENALYSAVAQVAQKSNLVRGLPRLAAEIALRKPARPEFYVELGQAWLNAGKPVNAVVAFEEAAKRNPDSPVVALNLADALTRARQPLRAVGVLKRALNSATTDALLWYQLGIAQSSAGKESDAILAFEKCLSVDPELAEAHNLLGAAVAARGDLDRAAREFNAALQINPDLPDAQGNLGHLLAARGDLIQAAFYLARAVQLKPKDGEMRTNYAVTLAGLNRLEEARREIDQAVKLDRKSPEAHNFRGVVLERQELPGEALAEFLQAVRLQPEFGRAHLNAARILTARGERSAAEGHLRLAARDPDPNVQRQATGELRRLDGHP